MLQSLLNTCAVCPGHCCMNRSENNVTSLFLHEIETAKFMNTRPTDQKGACCEMNYSDGKCPHKTDSGCELWGGPRPIVCRAYPFFRMFSGEWVVNRNCPIQYQVQLLLPEERDTLIRELEEYYASEFSEEDQHALATIPDSYEEAIYV